jgi:hypothetical protein
MGGRADVRCKMSLSIFALVLTVEKSNVASDLLGHLAVQ